MVENTTMQIHNYTHNYVGEKDHTSASRSMENNNAVPVSVCRPLQPLSVD